MVQSMKKRCRHLSPPTPKVAFYSGLTRPHILQHVSEEPIFGLSTAEELARHGLPRTAQQHCFRCSTDWRRRLSGIIGAKEWPSKRRVFHKSRKGRRAMAAAKARGSRVIRRAYR